MNFELLLEITLKYYCNVQDCIANTKYPVYFMNIAHNVGNLHITSKKFLKILYLMILQCFLTAASLLLRLVRLVRLLSYLDFVEYNMTVCGCWHRWYSGLIRLEFSAAAPDLGVAIKAWSFGLIHFVFYTLISDGYILYHF